jgi:hypothetical protein
MASWWTRLAGVEPARASALGLGVAVALCLAAYLFSAVTSPPTPGGIAAGLALLAVAGAGLLYAWPSGAGYHAD